MERLSISILLMIMACVCSADILRFRVSKLVDDGYEVKMDIVFDTVEQTGLLTPGRDSRSSCPWATINLHDYKTNMLALKQVDTGMCFIRPSNETLLGAIAMVQQEKMVDAKVLPLENWKIDRKVLSYTTTKTVAGHNIAEFCRDYEIHNLIPSTTTQHERKRRCDFICIGCVVGVDDEPQAGN